MASRLRSHLPPAMWGLASLGAAALVVLVAAAWAYSVAHSPLGHTEGLSAAGDDVGAVVASDGHVAYAIRPGDEEGAAWSFVTLEGARRSTVLTLPAAPGPAPANAAGTLDPASWRDGAELATPAAAHLAEGGTVASSAGIVDLRTGTVAPHAWPDAFVPLQRDGQLVYGTVPASQAPHLLPDGVQPDPAQPEPRVFGVHDLAQPGVFLALAPLPRDAVLLEATAGKLVIALPGPGAEIATTRIATMDPDSSELVFVAGIVGAPEAVVAHAHGDTIVVASQSDVAVLWADRRVGDSGSVDLPKGAAFHTVRTDGERWVASFGGVGTSKKAQAVGTGFAFGDVGEPLDPVVHVADGRLGAAAPQDGAIYLVEAGQLAVSRPGTAPLPVVPTALAGAAMGVAAVALALRRYGPAGRVAQPGACSECGRPKESGFGFCLGCGLPM